jgi:hypothetical protein
MGKASIEHEGEEKCTQSLAKKPRKKDVNTKI